MTNRLADATSPYLLQHADNPVDWWPWATRRSRRRGGGTCRSCSRSGTPPATGATSWRTSRSRTPATAALINARFVAVKVDREERPDVDAVYMEATQAMTGQGGWPMTVFLTPDGRAVLRRHLLPAGRRGTACPRSGSCSRRSREAWHDQRDEVVESASGSSPRCRRSACRPGDAGRSDAAELLRRGGRRCWPAYDAARGGFGGAPKFPPSMVLEFLLRHHARTGDGGRWRWPRGRWRAMARGGMYDQLGGGFARYSVDAGWVVPHFEKMLYDNALLLRVYAAPVAGDRLGRSPGGSRARPPTSCSRELRTAEGGFAVVAGRRHRAASRAHLRLDAGRAASRCSAPRTARGRPSCSR